MLGLNNNEYTPGDIQENLEDGDMSPEDAALYGATLAQEAYRDGDLSRGEFQEYLDQARQVTVEGTGDVQIPDVDASVEDISAIDEIHSNQRSYENAREWVSGHEGMEQADILAVPGPQNIGVGANMADELGLEYAVMVAQDEDTKSLGPNADEESVVSVDYGGDDYDIELHGDAQDFEGKTTVVGGTTWGRNMTEADTFLDAPLNNSEHAFTAVEADRGIRETKEETGEKEGLTQTVKDALGF